MGIRVLLIYPCHYRVTGLPVGLATLSAVLKACGHEVRIFDTAFYMPEQIEDQTRIRAERMMSKEVTGEDQYLVDRNTNMEMDIIDNIISFQPDLIGISVLEVVYEKTVKIARLIKDRFEDIPVIVGGVFPSLSPEIVIEEESIDMICVGEGESSLTELCKMISEGAPYNDVEGLWVKYNGQVYRNKPSQLHDIDQLPHPDYKEFDERLFFKPMQGKIYKMVNIVTSRGCSYGCSFCAAPRLMSFYRQNNCGRYNRSMSMDKIIEQIHFQIDMHSPEFIYFSSENFLAMNETDFRIFVKAYDKIRIPFWIQTRIETIAKERLADLIKIGLHWLTIGLEHGNEEFRRRVLKRNYPNEMFFERMEILRSLGIGASINNIMGFPFETRDLIFDTIHMNKELWQRNQQIESNIFLLTPYRGCELYDVCRQNGYLEDNLIISSSDMSDKSVLNFPESFKKELTGLLRTFNLYVRMPEYYYDQIRIAELPDEEGNSMLNHLNQLLKDQSH